MKAVQAALIGIVLAPIGVGLAQEAQATPQPPARAMFTMMRDVVGAVTARRQVQLEGAVESADLRGCHDPADIEWRRLPALSVERAVLYTLRGPDLARVVDTDTGRSRYGLRLPSGKLGLVQDGDDGSPAASRVTNGITVIDGATEQPVPGARVLLLADRGRAEPLVCLLDTDSDGAAVLPLAQRVLGTVVAAEGFVGGAVVPDRSGTARLARSRTVSGRVQGGLPSVWNIEGGKRWIGYGLVAAVPHKKPGGEDEDIVAAAMVGPDREFALHGIHPSTSRLLLALFLGDSLAATSLHALPGSPAVVPFDDASVTFASADPDARAELRLLRLPDGSRVRDYALGPMARPRLQQEESSYSRRRLPSGWYDIRAHGRTLAEFFLAADQDLDLGVLGTVEKFTLEVRGLDGRTGEVWWSRALCFDDERGHGSTRTAVGPRQPVTLWIPEGCKRIWGQVQAPGMVADAFDWNRGKPLSAVVTLRPGYAITGTAWAPTGQPLQNARVSAFAEFELARSRDGRYPIPAATGVVDEEGRFELVVLRPVPFFVKAAHSSYFAPAHRVDLYADPAPDLVIEARQGAAVAGIVRSPSGRPVEDAIVHWCYLGREPVVLPNAYAGAEGCRKQRPAGRDRDEAELARWNLEGGQTIRTDATGTFRTEAADGLGAALFTALPPGEVEFSVRPWAGPAETSVHKLEPGDNEIEIVLRNGNRIEGEVSGLPEGNGAIEVHMATGTEPDVWTRWAPKKTNAVDGVFLFENLPDGPRPFHLYASAPGHRSLESRIVLQQGEGTRTVALELVPNSSAIEGSVDPFELGAEPRLTATSRTADVRTVAIDAGGAFALADLPVGEWRLVLSHGVPSGREQIRFPRGIRLMREAARERIDIDLGSLPTLHFVGSEAGTLEIRGLGEGDYAFGPLATVPADETGQATIHAPEPGAYIVSYRTRPRLDGTTESYVLRGQWLEGVRTLYLEDFDSEAEVEP